jgi:hypothetical protein
MEAFMATPKLGILDQISLAIQPKNRLASLVGGILGGFIPCASFVLAHIEATTNPVIWALVAAGMLYSALTVFQWSLIAFKYWPKALGFVILTEGVAIFAQTSLLAYGALTILVAINAVSTGYNLVADRRVNRAAAVVRPARKPVTAAKRKHVATRPKATALAASA